MAFIVSPWDSTVASFAIFIALISLLTSLLSCFPFSPAVYHYWFFPKHVSSQWLTVFWCISTWCYQLSHSEFHLCSIYLHIHYIDLISIFGLHSICCGRWHPPKFIQRFKKLFKSLAKIFIWNRSNLKWWK